MREQLTKQDVEKIQQEIEHRKLVVRKEAIEAVKEARAHGDLSENYEYYAAKKDKNQNILEKKHIDDIIEAYLDRKDVDKFAHVATIDEIKENGYNLNIPRYVDTFEEEELIDIEEVQNNIARLKIEIAEAEAKMEKYLKELGL